MAKNFWDDDDRLDFPGDQPAGPNTASLFAPVSMFAQAKTMPGKRKPAAQAAAPTSSQPKPAPIPPAKGVGYVPATMVPLEVIGDLPFQNQVTRVSKKYNMAEDDLYASWRSKPGTPSVRASEIKGVHPEPG